MIFELKMCEPFLTVFLMHFKLSSLNIYFQKFYANLLMQIKSYDFDFSFFLIGLAI